MQREETRHARAAAVAWLLLAAHVEPPLPAEVAQMVAELVVADVSRYSRLVSKTHDHLLPPPPGSSAPDLDAVQAYLEAHGGVFL